MTRILHTADWQIGRQYSRFASEDAVALAEARFAVVDRMNKWNEVSLSYADQMHRTAKAMGGILDELEAR